MIIAQAIERRDDRESSTNAISDAKISCLYELCERLIWLYYACRPRFTSRTAPVCQNARGRGWVVAGLLHRSRPPQSQVRQHAPLPNPRVARVRSETVCDTSCRLRSSGTRLQAGDCSGCSISVGHVQEHTSHSPSFELARVSW